MKQSKDPFEAALESPESQPDSPTAPEPEAPAADEEANVRSQTVVYTPSTGGAAPSASVVGTGKAKEDEEEDEEENMDVDLGKCPSGDPVKMAKMQAILSQFTEEQMSRYESFRRSGFQKANMKRLLGSITGSQKISVPMTIVVSGIAKMFVGELVETGRVIMTERKESGPIRPCHIREAYRRLKAEGKVPRRSVRRLFR